MLADTRRELTEALGMVMDHPGPLGVLGNLRCKRFALFVDDGVIKVIGGRWSTSWPSWPARLSPRGDVASARGGC